MSYLTVQCMRPRWYNTLHVDPSHVLCVPFTRRRPQTCLLCWGCHAAYNRGRTQIMLLVLHTSSIPSCCFGRPVYHWQEQH